MRSMSLSTFLVSAIASLSLASGCKSGDSTAATGKADEPASAAGSTGAGQPADQAPVLPVPRRMRGSEPADDTGGEAPPAPGRRAGQRSEAMRQRLEEARKRFDADGDGQLDEDERAAMRHERLQRRIERIDSNADGKISREEADATPAGGRMLRDFDSADANQDSFVSPEELEAVMSERESRRMERWRQRQRRAEPGTEPAPPASE